MKAKFWTEYFALCYCTLTWCCICRSTLQELGSFQGQLVTGGQKLANKLVSLRHDWGGLRDDIAHLRTALSEGGDRIREEAETGAQNAAQQVFPFTTPKAYNQPHLVGRILKNVGIGNDTRQILALPKSAFCTSGDCPHGHAIRHFLVWADRNVTDIGSIFTQLWLSPLGTYLYTLQCW